MRRGEGQLQDRRRPWAADDPAGRDLAPEVDHPPPIVQEEEVEREPHPERVDAPAARDQQPLAGSLEIKQGEAKNARPAGHGDGYPVAENGRRGKGTEAVDPRFRDRPPVPSPLDRG